MNNGVGSHVVERGLVSLEPYLPHAAVGAITRGAEARERRIEALLLVRGLGLVDGVRIHAQTARLVRDRVETAGEREESVVRSVERLRNGARVEARPHDGGHTGRTSRHLTPVGREALLGVRNFEILVERHGLGALTIN